MRYKVTRAADGLWYVRGQRGAILRSRGFDTDQQAWDWIWVDEGPEFRLTRADARRWSETLAKALAGVDVHGKRYVREGLVAAVAGFLCPDAAAADDMAWALWFAAGTR